MCIRDRICIEAIEEAKDFGVKTIVDATPNDGYRDPELYKIVSLKTGVNIICSTGFYSEPLGATGYFKHRYGLSGDSTRIVKDMYEILMKEISDGIGGSTVKPGVIKVGSSKGEITPYPDGHLKIPHLWPGQNPPPQGRQNGW